MRTPSEPARSKKPAKRPPHEFVLDALSPLSPQTRPMFGCLAVYIGNKIMLILRDKPGDTDNGVWLATTKDHHQSLLQEFPAMRSIGVFGHASPAGKSCLSMLLILNKPRCAPANLSLPAIRELARCRSQRKLRDKMSNRRPAKFPLVGPGSTPN